MHSPLWPYIAIPTNISLHSHKHATYGYEWLCMAGYAELCMAMLGYVRPCTAIYDLIRYTVTIIIIYKVPTKKWKDGLLYLPENFLP